jgi:hypothetical protein
MAEDQLSASQGQSLTRRKDGTVRGLLENEDSFEKPAHRMHRVGQPEMSERIGEQKIAEIVRCSRHGNRVLAEQRQPTSAMQAAVRAANFPAASSIRWRNKKTTASNAASPSAMKSLAPKPAGFCEGRKKREKRNRFIERLSF